MTIFSENSRRPALHNFNNGHYGTTSEQILRRGFRGDLHDVRLLDGYNANIDDANLGRELPNFRGWRCVRHVKGGMQIGVSLISLEQARRNLAAEIGERTFEEVVAGTKAEWERHFSRIEIDAPEDVKTIFYTGLFHTLLYPRQIDEQGRYYSAFDDKVHDGVMYNCYSLWDTYRAEHPWLTLIAPERVDGMMQSLLEMYREGGWLPKWPNPGYTGIMVGAPEKTQQHVREIMTRSYSTDRKGFDGNEDCGQMSAWYIFSALGLYPLDPVSGCYEIGSPIVRGARLHLGAPYAPATLEIRVKNYAPDRWRVRRVTLNGVELKEWRVRHSDLVKGGVLEFEMMNEGGHTPQNARFTGLSAISTL